MLKIGRNDPCPCGSGKKYKNCCIKNDSIPSVVFSYANFRHAYGYSPMWPEKDWEKIKNDDGNIAKKTNTQGLEVTGNNYFVQTSFGPKVFPEFMFRIDRKPDMSVIDISTNPELINQLLFIRKLDILTWPFGFHTVALIENEMYSYFAMVSSSPDDQEDFIVRSELYPIKHPDKVEFIQYLYENDVWFYTGIMKMGLEFNVYIFPVWLLHKWIIGKYGDLPPEAPQLEEVQEYLDNVGDKSKLSDFKFSELSTKYLRLCEILMEKATYDDNLKINLKMAHYKKWTQELIRIQTNNRQIDPDQDQQWNDYQNQIENIIDEMILVAKTNQNTLSQVQHEFDIKYNYLEDDARQYLIQAETLYRLNKEHLVDFTPIVIEYVKVLERQLKICIQHDNISAKFPSLGAIISYIEQNRVMPYAKRIWQLIEVKQIRNSGAHVGYCSLSDVDKIRRYYYDNKLLELLRAP